MSTTVQVNGTSYAIPSSGDVDWAGSLTTFLTAMTQASSLQLNYVAAAPGTAAFIPISGVATTGITTHVVPVTGKIRVVSGFTGTAGTGAITYSIYYDGTSVATTAVSAATTNFANVLLIPVSVVAGHKVQLYISVPSGTAPTNVNLSLLVTPN